jgi:hypothetical protein
MITLFDQTQGRTLRVPAGVGKFFLPPNREKCREVSISVKRLAPGEGFFRNIVCI